MRKCCICDTPIAREDAPVLTIGGFGNPKWLCDSCEQLLDTVTLGREYSEIAAGLDELGRRMGECGPDKLTLDTVNGIVSAAAERAKEIKSGGYDFSLDEKNEDSELDELPSELAESEEDRELDRRDEEKNKRFDKFYNGLLIGSCIVVGAVIVWKIIELIFS